MIKQDDLENLIEAFEKTNDLLEGALAPWKGEIKDTGTNLIVANRTMIRAIKNRLSGEG